MNHKKRIFNIVIIFFFISILSAIIFNCFREDEKKTESALVDSADNKYFSSSRIKNKKEKNTPDKSEELKMLVFNKEKNETVRVVFNHPVLYDEEIGKVFNKLFIFFNPGIKGKFITRSDRIIDFIPDAVENKEAVLIIPKGLYSINGNILNNEIKINISFNNFQEETLTFFDNINNNEGKKINIYSLLKKIGSSDYKKTFEPAVFKVTSEIDLENPKENRINFSGDINIKRYYKRIEKNDVPDIIKNMDTLLNIKNYFLAKKLNTLPNLYRSEIDNGSAAYIPSTRKGIYFCYQEIKDNTKRDFFQLYNFSTDRFIAFDTEESILIWDKSNNKGDAKITIYSASGKIIAELKKNNSSFYKIKNDEYSEIYIFKESIENSLYRVKLNKIVKSEYNIFSVIDESDPKSSAITGIITNRDGSSIKEIRSLKLSFKIASNKKNIFQDTIQNLQNDGSFKYIFKKNIFMESNLSIDYYNYDKLIKKCKFRSPQNDSQFFADHKSDSLKIIKSKEDTVFYNGLPTFIIKEDYADQIDSIFVNIKGENNKNTDIMLEPPINKTIDINLPPEEGEYILSFEFYLKNGNSITNNLKVKKINSIDTGKTIVYNNDTVKNENGNLFYEIFNPFDADEGALILFNNELHYYEKINLDNGYNKIYINSKFITNSNMKVLVLLSDINNKIIYNLKNNLTADEKTDNLSASIENENDENFILATSFNKSKYLNKKLYINYTPLNNDSKDDLFVRYNDFINPQVDYNDIFPGKLIEIDKNYSGKNSLIKYKSGNYNLNVFLRNERGEILNTKKTFKGKKLVETIIKGPDEIDILDKPEYLITVKNKGADDIIIDTLIKVNNEVMFSKQKIYIKGNSELFITYNSQENKNTGIINLAIEIISQRKLINKTEKKIKVKKELSKQSIEINGTLYEKDKTSSYLKLPESDENTFNIDVILSRNKSIDILKSNPVLDNYVNTNLELDFLKYLDTLTKNYLFAVKSDVGIIYKYYIKDRGFKRNPGDKTINIDSTMLILFSALIIPEIANYFDTNEIITYLITNFKDKIMMSPLRIFIMAEYGLFFENISKEFLTNIENVHGNILFYRYYKNNNFKNNYKTSFDSYYDSYKLSDGFYALFENYFGINNNVNTNEDFIFNQYPVELIFEKLISIKVNTKNNNNKNTKGDISFKSKKLGEFQIDLMNSDLFVKRYSFDLPGSIKNERLIDYTIEKRFSGELNYIIKADYKTVPGLSENNNIYLYSEWTDESGDILNKNNLLLQKDAVYKVNIYLITNKALKNILIMPVSSSTLDLDRDSFIMNDEKINFTSDKKDFINIKNIDKGLNIISFSVKPEYSGIFKLNGFILTDFFDSTNFFREKSSYITVINKF